jgi:hypothetical protein
MSLKLAWGTHQEPISKKKKVVQVQWITAVILATPAAVIRRITAQASWACWQMPVILATRKV